MERGEGTLISHFCHPPPTHFILRCWLRQGHTLTQFGNMMLVFGGTLVKDGSTTNDVFWITMDRMEWHMQPCKGDRPAAR